MLGYDKEGLGAVLCGKIAFHHILDVLLEIGAEVVEAGRYEDHHLLLWLLQIIREGIRVLARPGGFALVDVARSDELHEYSGKKEYSDNLLCHSLQR